MLHHAAPEAWDARAGHSVGEIPGCQKFTRRMMRLWSELFSTECSKESSKTRHFPSFHVLGAWSPAIMWQPSGIINPKWQVRRMFVGPQCVRSLVCGLSNENKASPTPRRAHSTASGLDAKAVLVAGQRWRFTKHSSESPKRTTSRHSPAEINPPSWVALSPTRPQEIPRRASSSALMLSYDDSNLRQSSKWLALCQGCDFKPGKKCPGRW